VNTSASDRAYAAAIEQGRQTIAATHGPWVQHNIHLGAGVWTIHPEATVGRHRVRQVLQLAGDLMQTPLHELRVLDLGCGEGQMALEFALHGATVLGLDARDANLAKARFAAGLLQPAQLRFERDDVRRISADRTGRFDVVLCLQLLEHLPGIDQLRLLAAVHELCTGLLLIDTVTAPAPKETFAVRNLQIQGRTIAEFPPGANLETIEAAANASVDADPSFRQTLASLSTLLQSTGFSSVVQCHIPVDPVAAPERVVLAARPGSLATVATIPPLNRTPALGMAEPMGWAARQWRKVRGGWERRVGGR
jgi:2-polyprenyl-3-methyl-5-hydroxy-6-metoxy-1,4-benzoquinol methylase